MRIPGSTWSPTPNLYQTGEPVDLLVMHYTAAGPASGSVAWLCKPEAKASAHVVIERDGRVWQLAELTARTWHAGGSTSRWNGLGVNTRSIGIELANWGPLKGSAGSWLTHTGRPYSGPTPHIDARGAAWEPYPEAQIAALEGVCRHLLGQFPRLKTPSGGRQPRVVGHQDVDPVRKTDPGPAFPWDRVRGWFA